MVGYLSGLVLFVGVHSLSIVAPTWRQAMIGRIGRNAWRGVYALASLVGLYLIVTGYADLRNQTMVLYVLPRWIQGITATLMIPVFPLLVASYFPGWIKTLARHPTLVAVKLWAVAHLLANGTLADVLLFGTLLAWAVAVRISLKRRAPIDPPMLPAGRFNDLIVIVVGAALYAFMLNGGHAMLIGMPLVLR